MYSSFRWYTLSFLLYFFSSLFSLLLLSFGIETRSTKLARFHFFVTTFLSHWQRKKLEWFLRGTLSYCWAGDDDDDDIKTIIRCSCS